MANDFQLLEFTFQNKRLLRSFIDLPYQLHCEQANWIAPLRLQMKDILNAKHPFWQSADYRLAMVERQGKFLGRIMAIFPKSTPQEMHFGFVEFADNQQVSQLLFQFLEQQAKQHNCTKILGPFSPSINYELGILSSGFDAPPKFMMPYHPPYYEQHFLQKHWQIEKTFWAYDLPVKDFQFPPKMERIQHYLAQRYRISFRNMNFKNLKSETQLIHDIYNDAFANHWGYQPFLHEELQAMGSELKLIADHDLLFFVELNEQAMGFIIALPDLNEVLQFVPNGRLFPFGWWHLLTKKSSIKEVRVLNAAIRNSFKNRGLGVLLYHELHRRLGEKGYYSGEMSWVVEDNLSMNNAIQALGARRIKSYRIFSKKVSN